MASYAVLHAHTPSLAVLCSVHLLGDESCHTVTFIPFLGPAAVK